ncbi:MAG: gliding motility-associated-like protein [Paraglaciecola sp.]|jgi:gliding motility-associated-like protein
MVSRIIPLALLLLTSILGNAQTPQSIQIQQSTGSHNGDLPEIACADQFAGTVSFANFSGASNDIDLDTIYFCFNDQIDIIGNGDADLTGDPDMGTTPGVTYGFYDCPPTIMGLDLNTVLMDNCIIDTPVPVNGIFVTAGGAPSGDITFSNNGTTQTFFNGGDPILVWFAPITIDDFGDKEYEDDGMGGNAGPCVNVNTDQAFAVVYLNEVVASNMSTMSSTGGCVGSFDIAGGLPEFDGSDYDITIELVTDPMVTGTLMAPGGVTHGDMVNFTVPQPGVYSVIILDEKSCPEVILMDFSACQILEMEISALTVAPGSNVCVQVTVNGGFENIIALGWSFNFDETVFSYTGATNFNPNLGGLNGSTLNQPGPNPGSIIFAWNSFSGENLADGVLLYELCFDAIGTPGNCSAIEFTNDPFPNPNPIEVGIDDTPNPTQIGFEGINGQICIDGATIGLVFMQTPASCPGQSDGDFTVDINGGTAPYQLQWQAVGGGPTQGPVNVNANTFTTPMNQAPGCYSVTVTDGTSAVVDTVCVEAPAGIDILFDDSTPLCNGDNGEIVVQLVDLSDTTIVTNFTGYTFMWSNGSMDISSGPIPVGIYSVTVTQPNGCTEANSTTLFQPPPFDVDINITSASCSGIDDGAISITIAGATPDINNNYTINWPTIGSGLTFMNNVSNVSGLEPTDYPLMITDNNGCTFNDIITVDAIKTLSVNAIVQDVLCNGTNTGSIFAVGMTSGAAADEPYNFQWLGNPAPPAPMNTSTETQLTGLEVGLSGFGIYNLMMTDAAGCQIDTTFEITEPEILDATLLAFTSETCNVGNDGTATLGVTGGTYPYDYNWGSGIANDSLVNNLSSGMYTVTVTDFNLCTDTVQVTITQPVSPLVTMFDDTTLNCPGGDDGSLTVVVDNPGNIISYAWMPNVGIDATVTGLSVGEYFVTITANDGCITIDTALVTAPEVLTLDSVVTVPPVCPGDGGGQISLFISGGTAPYFFDWPVELDIFDGVGNATAADVAAGTYTITVLDANLCAPLTFDVTLADPPTIMVDFSALDSVSCFNSGGFCDGGATATAMYSDGSTGIFNFTWSSGEADNSVMMSTASQLCRGEQFITVSDGTCFVIDAVFIPSPDSLRIGSITKENVSCTGETDGSITLQAAGGTPSYSYTWSTNETGPTISNLAPGIYIAVIEDSNGCSFTVSTEIEEPDPFILLQADLQDVSCNGFDNGSYTVTYQGGTVLMGTPTYTWSNGIAPASSSIAQNLIAGTYSVTGTDDKGCQAEISFMITEPGPIGFNIADIPAINCFNESTFITVDSAFGGSNTIFAFEVDNFGESLLGTLYPIFAGEHTITVYDKGVMDGCFVDTIITITEPAPISIDLPAMVEIELGDTLFQMNPAISATTQIDSFIWSPTTGLLCPNDTFMIVNCPNPVVNIFESMTYSLAIIDENGCQASDEIFIDVDANRNVFIPNIFSPNDDGRNDIFRIYTGLGVESINYFRVFNRWGSPIYDMKDIAPTPDGTVGWDGLYNGERLNPDVYVYLIEVTFLDGETLLYRGDVTLLR